VSPHKNGVSHVKTELVKSDSKTSEHDREGNEDHEEEKAQRIFNVEHPGEKAELNGSQDEIDEDDEEEDDDDFYKNPADFITCQYEKVQRTK